MTTRLPRSHSQLKLAPMAGSEFGRSHKKRKNFSSSRYISILEKSNGVLSGVMKNVEKRRICEQRNQSGFLSGYNQVLGKSMPKVEILGI